MEKITEYSTGNPRNALYLYVGLVFFILLALFSFYKWVFLEIRQPAELVFSLAFAGVLYERVKTRCKYEANDDHLRIVKYGIFGQKEVSVRYKDIFGIYLYKPQLLGVVSFRYTYRLHSGLDRNKVWTLAYKIKKDSGKEANSRVFFKPSEELLEFLNKKLPDKIFRGVQGT